MFWWLIQEMIYVVLVMTAEAADADVIPFLFSLNDCNPI